MVARFVRDEEVPGSNPGSPTSMIKEGTVVVPSFVSEDFRFVWYLSGRRGRVELALKHYLEVLLVA